MSARFNLDETKAATWLARCVAQTDRFYSGENTGAPELEIGSGYDPCSDHEGIDTASLVWGGPR